MILRMIFWGWVMEENKLEEMKKTKAGVKNEIRNLLTKGLMLTAATDSSKEAANQFFISNDHKNDPILIKFENDVNQIRKIEQKQKNIGAELSKNPLKDPLDGVEEFLEIFSDEKTRALANSTNYYTKIVAPKYSEQLTEKLKLEKDQSPTVEGTRGTIFNQLTTKPAVVMPRIVLLLKELEKNTLETDPDFDRINTLLKASTEIANKINETVEKLETEAALEGKKHQDMLATFDQKLKGGKKISASSTKEINKSLEILSERLKLTDKDIIGMYKEKLKLSNTDTEASDSSKYYVEIYHETTRSHIEKAGTQIASKISGKARKEKLNRTEISDLKTMLEQFSALVYFEGQFEQKKSTDGNLKQKSESIIAATEKIMSTHQGKIDSKDIEEIKTNLNKINEAISHNEKKQETTQKLAELNKKAKEEKAVENKKPAVEAASTVENKNPAAETASKSAAEPQPQIPPAISPAVLSQFGDACEKAIKNLNTAMYSRDESKIATAQIEVLNLHDVLEEVMSNNNDAATRAKLEAIERKLNNVTDNASKEIKIDASKEAKVDASNVSSIRKTETNNKWSKFAPPESKAENKTETKSGQQMKEATPDNVASKMASHRNASHR